MRACEVLKEEHGRRKKYILCYNKQLAKDDALFRENRVDKTKKRLDKILENIRSGRLKDDMKIAGSVANALKAEKAKKYFKITYHKSGFSYEIKKKVKEKEERFDGFYVLSTTRIELKCEEVIKIYKERDLIERAIRTLKSFIDIRPIFIYKEEQVRGHVFICFLALQIRAIMNYMVKKSELEMSIEDVLEYLNRIKVIGVTFADDHVKVYRKISSLSDRQIIIVDVLGISDEFKDGKV